MAAWVVTFAGMMHGIATGLRGRKDRSNIRLRVIDLSQGSCMVWVIHKERTIERAFAAVKQMAEVLKSKYLR